MVTSRLFGVYARCITTSSLLNSPPDPPRSRSRAPLPCRALRSAPLSIDYDCWFDARSVGRRGSCDSYELRIDARAPMLPVESAFNGLSVYRFSKLTRASRRCMYDGSATCEHVAFHACLRRDGLRIAIAPFLEQGCGNGAPRPPPPNVRVRVLGDGSIQVKMHTGIAKLDSWTADRRQAHELTVVQPAALLSFY
eukprot:2739576-Pleurochrysis_carterae.AAC.1